MEKEKVLFETNDISEALLIKSKLEAEGIIVLMKGESVGGSYALTTNGWGRIKIIVSDEQFEEAKEILERKDE
ncbi:MAG: DUF2007 domain-containing protein [Candidatus Firestonebacteria bacterium]